MSYVYMIFDTLTIAYLEHHQSQQPECILGPNLSGRKTGRHILCMRIMLRMSISVALTACKLAKRNRHLDIDEPV